MTFLTSAEYDEVSDILHPRLEEFELFQVIIVFKDQLGGYGPLL